MQMACQASGRLGATAGCFRLEKKGHRPQPKGGAPTGYYSTE